MKRLFTIIFLFCCHFVFGQNSIKLTVADIENIYCIADISKIELLLKSKNFKASESNGKDKSYSFEQKTKVGQTTIILNGYSNNEGFSEIYLKTNDTILIKQINASCITYGYTKLKNIVTNSVDKYYWQKDIQLVGTKVRFVLAGTSNKILDYKFFIETKFQM